jgi:phosphonate transport system substrate-binding protein
MPLKRLTTALVLMGLVSCTPAEPVNTDKMIIGVVSYDNAEVSLEKYQRFQNYLGEQTKIPLELEIAYNELQAVDQIERGNWDIVFAPPGLAALATQRGYTQLFPLERADISEHSLIVVLEDSSITRLVDLSFKPVAMGKPGSAAGYYLPLYNLYGLTLEEVYFAPTPKTILEWVSDGTVAAGAISEQEFEQYQRDFPEVDFRVLNESRRSIPPGVVLLGVVERGQGEYITRVMKEAPADITSDARYIPTAELPDYSEMIRVVEKIKPLESQVKQVPAVLTLEHLETGEAETTGN